MTPTFQRLTVTFAVTLLAACGSGGLHPDQIYFNAKIVAMDDAETPAQAVAMLGEEIVAVGSDAEIKAMAGPKTKSADLRGQTLLPGFYAAHDHFPRAGDIGLHQVDLNSPPIGKIETIPELIAAMRERAEKTPQGEWVVGRGYDDTLLAEKRHPTRADLDQVSTSHPIWIIHTSGHLGVANTPALALAGITRGTPNPEGGVIRKDPKSGEPDGVFEEAGGLVSRFIPALTDEQRMESFRNAAPMYMKQGVTTSVIAGGTRSSLIDLQNALREGLVPMRIVTMMSRNSVDSPSAPEDGGFISGFGGFRLKLGAIKNWHDGSNQGFTGYFTEPYHTAFKGDPGYRGFPRRSREALTTMVKELHRGGYQVATHANGDAAIDDVIQAYREAQQDFPRNDTRHRIEHCQTPREDQLDAIAELGISPSFFVGHVFYWGDRHKEIFLGPERAERISPLASALKRGIRFTVHDDTPVTPVDPLQLVWVSVNRLTKGGEVLGPEQRISVREALKAVTINAAWQNFEENRKGSIEPGKLADFVLLAENPFEVEPEHIRDIEIVATIVGGEKVWGSFPN